MVILERKGRRQEEKEQVNGGSHCSYGVTRSRGMDVCVQIVLKILYPSVLSKGGELTSTGSHLVIWRLLVRFFLV